MFVKKYKQFILIIPQTKNHQLVVLRFFKAITSYKLVLITIDYCLFSTGGCFGAE